MNEASPVSWGWGPKRPIQTYNFAKGGNRRDAKLGLDSGLLRAVVSSVSQPSKFEVDTATSVAAARSTDWFVEALPSATVVSVLDGSVVVEPRQQTPAPAAPAAQPAGPARLGATRPAAPAAIPLG